MADTCKNCGRPIRQVNYSMGPEWMHGGGPHGDQYPVGQYEMHSAYSECRTTRAEPAVGEETPAHSRSDIPDLIDALRVAHATINRVRELAEKYVDESVYDTDAGTAAEIFAAHASREKP